MKLLPASNKLLWRRLAVFFAIIISFGGLLTLYSQNQEMLSHYKPYYLRSYMYVLEHKLAQIVNRSPAEASGGSAGSIPVLVYHGMIPKPDSVSTSLEQFKDEMFALKKEGYQTVNIADFDEYIKGKKQLPDKSFLLTFDDGRKDSYYPVDPILKELHYTAVMFVITGTLGPATNKFHLTIDELRQMQKSGRWDLEAHTYEGHGLIDTDSAHTKGHFYSNKMWLPGPARLETDAEFTSRITSDLTRAKQDMKNIFGIDSFALAFPFNDYARDSKNFPGAQAIFDSAAKSIYERLFYQAEPTKGFSTNLFGSNAPLIRRINVETAWGASDLMATMTAIREKSLPISFDTLNSKQGWLSTLGIMFFDKEQLNLNSEGATTTAATLLDGTGSISRYQMDMDLSWNNASVFGVQFNQRLKSEYFVVTLSKDTLRVSKVSSEKIQNLLEKPISIPLTENLHHLTFIQNKNSISVNIDGQNLLSNYIISDQSDNGAIGFEVWNAQLNNAVATIKDLHVRTIE